MKLSPGTRLGPYEIKELIGSGGMGYVYRARDTRLGRDVAVKVLSSLGAADRHQLNRFLQEARAPSLVTIRTSSPSTTSAVPTASRSLFTSSWKARHCDSV